jgi:SulP family sulfate permease
MDNFLESDDAITFLFHRVLDPAVCIYECETRAFKECQNLPKQIFPLTALAHTVRPRHNIPEIAPLDLWHKIHKPVEQRPLLIDVREPREFHQGHIAGAELVPLPELLSDGYDLPQDQEIILMCRGGRRSERAAAVLQDRGYKEVTILRGGILAWEAAGLLEAVD